MPSLAAQLAYSLLRRADVEDPLTQQVATTQACAIVASYMLAGGILTGKYDMDPQAGRAAGTLSDQRWAAAVAAGRGFAALAKETGRDSGEPCHGVRAAQPRGRRRALRGRRGRSR